MRKEDPLFPRRLAHDLSRHRVKTSKGEISCKPALFIRFPEQLNSFSPSCKLCCRKKEMHDAFLKIYNHPFVDVIFITIIPTFNKQTRKL